MKILKIENDLFNCSVIPEVGGSIYSFNGKIGDEEQPLLRQTTDPNTSEVLNYGSWPLVPFSNRIKYGKFNYDGQDYSIERNYLGGPNGVHASHGQGWARPWQVAEQTSTKCVLRFSFGDTPGDKKYWPFPYAAEQVFELTDRSMRFRLSLTNTGKTSMPAGIGAHPYFPKTPGTTLQAKITGLWEIDSEVIPVKHVSVPSEYEFSNAKSLDHARLDSCFDGYGGLMQVVWPDRPLALNLKSSKNLGHFVVYTPQGENFFCAEPVSHMPDAINRPGQKGNGLVFSKPGETIVAEYEFEALVRPQASSNSALAKLAKWAPLTIK